MPTRDNCPTSRPEWIPPIVEDAVPTFGGGRVTTLGEPNYGAVDRAAGDAHAR
jgi:hypothetical protein